MNRQAYEKMTVVQLKELLKQKYPEKDGYLQGYSGWKKADFVDGLMGLKQVPKSKAANNKNNTGTKENGMTKVQLARAIEKKYGYKTGTVKERKFLRRELVEFFEGKKAFKEQAKANTTPLTIAQIQQELTKLGVAFPKGRNKAFYVTLLNEAKKKSPKTSPKKSPKKSPNKKSPNKSPNIKTPPKKSPKNSPKKKKGQKTFLDRMPISHATSKYKTGFVFGYRDVAAGQIARFRSVYNTIFNVHYILNKEELTNPLPKSKYTLLYWGVIGVDGELLPLYDEPKKSPKKKQQTYSDFVCAIFKITHEQLYAHVSKGHPLLYYDPSDPTILGHFITTNMNVYKINKYIWANELLLPVDPKLQFVAANGLSGGFYMQSNNQGGNANQGYTNQKQGGNTNQGYNKPNQNYGKKTGPEILAEYGIKTRKDYLLYVKKNHPDYNPNMTAKQRDDIAIVNQAHENSKWSASQNKFLHNPQVHINEKTPPKRNY